MHPRGCAARGSTATVTWMNPLVEGKTYPSVAFRVERERVIEFGRVFGQTERIPPTFLTAAEFSAFPRVVSDPELGLDFMRVVHGSQEYELRRPIVLGETLEVTARIASIRRRGGNGVLLIATEMLGGDGAVPAGPPPTKNEPGPGR